MSGTRGHKSATQASAQDTLPGAPFLLCIRVPCSRPSPTCRHMTTHPPFVLPSILPSHSIQWERGFVLFYLNRIKEAADQFAWCTSLDPDDCEPFLWRCLVSCAPPPRSLPPYLPLSPSLLPPLPSVPPRMTCKAPKLVLERFTGYNKPPQTTTHPTLSLSLPHSFLPSRSASPSSMAGLQAWPYWISLQATTIDCV